MRNLLRLSLGVVALCATSLVMANGGGCCTTSGTSTTGTSCSPKTILIPRGAEMLRDQRYRYGTYGNECFSGEFDLEYTYQRTFKPCRIAESIFPSQTLSFVGSNVATRNATTDLMADYFGLAADTNITVKYCPRIQYHRFNIGLILGFNNVCDGLWLQINAPVIHTKWELRHNCSSNCSSNCGTPTTGTISNTAFYAGYMNHGTPPTTVAPLSSLENALQGKVFGDMTEAWMYGKFCGCDKDATKVGVVDVKLGYNFWDCPDYHVGIYAKFDAPTGTRLDCCHATCLFNPIIGDDHWKLGAGLTAHAELWNCDDCHTLTAYFEGYVTHLFERTQVRSFDFNNGVMSRYELLKVFNSDGITYSGRLINAIDYTTRRARVKVDVQGEALLELMYKHECGFGFGIGYNFYGRSHEKICKLCDPCNAAASTLKVGFKGCSPVQPVGYLTNGTVIDATATATYADTNFSATQSNATIFGCGTTDSLKELYVAATSNDPTRGFVYLDTRVTNTANIVPGTTTLSSLTRAQDSATGTLAMTNVGVVNGLTEAPTLITTANLNLCSGSAPSQIVNKVYGHLDYEWKDCDWTPYLRAGAEAEFAGHTKKGNLNMWGVFIGGGISF